MYVWSSPFHQDPSYRKARGRGREKKKKEEKKAIPAIMNSFSDYFGSRTKDMIN
jgi:hypothetical protein